MRVFVAGATGVIGRQLVALLVAAGHEVTGMVRGGDRIEAVQTMGAGAVVADALDPGGVEAAVGEVAPEVVVHQLTSIPARVDPRRFAEDFAATNRLRREATRNLEATALSAAGIESIVLRYGNFYGPGTRFAADGSDAELVRRRLFPVVGGGPGYWSFVHVQDAAQATVQAVQHGEPGVYNIVDGEPAPIAEWLPVYSQSLGAPAPPQTGPPHGDLGIHGMLRSRRASNSKAKHQLAWTPRYASWRQGFIAEQA